jgi:hypothetical protein
MREVDEAQDAIDHRIAQGDEREDGAKRQAVDELLEKFSQVVDKIKWTLMVLRADDLLFAAGSGFSRQTCKNIAALRRNYQLSTINRPGKWFGRS